MTGLGIFMPFTPLHLGPALAIGYIVRKRVHWPTFILANIIVDIEPLLVLVLGMMSYPLHGYLHTFISSLIMGSLLGYIMYKGLIDKVIVGADRIVRDAVINKIGTYTVAVLAHEHNVPFYVAAPISTFDLEKTSSQVIIEERDSREVTHVLSIQIAPDNAKVINPAFDITPLKYVSAIICEKGILRPKETNFELRLESLNLIGSQ